MAASITAIEIKITAAVSSKKMRRNNERITVKYLNSAPRSVDVAGSPDIVDPPLAIGIGPSLRRKLLT